MTKLLYVILDGLGDDPIPEFGGKTPLEEARTPNLDSLAAKGRTGTVTTVGEGIAPESDIAVFSILGYDANKYHAGRGPLEALGSGIDMQDGDVAWRANFATADDEGRLIDRRAGRDLSDEEATALADAINEHVKVDEATATFKATSEHRGVLHIRSSVSLSGEISNTDPAYERRGALGIALETFEPYEKPAISLDNTAGSKRAAAVTNEWSRQAQEALKDHPVNRARIDRGRPPANIVLLRDSGDHIPQVPSLFDLFGMKWACFAEMPVEIGISRITGMEPVYAAASGTDPSAYAELARKTVDTMGDFDALYIHIKGPDVPAHDGKFNVKRDCVAAIDEGYFGELLPEIGGDVVICVTADHSTSCVRKAHTADPVPLLIRGSGVSADGSTTFGETECANGAIGHIRGTEIVPMLAGIVRG